MLGHISAFLAIATVSTTVFAMDPEPVASIRADDPEMVAAIDAARQSVGQFIEAFSHPKPGQRAFLVKIAFSRNSQVEHLWIADLDFHGKTPTGVIADSPIRLDLKFMQRVDIDISQLSDWMYVEDGKLVGGYTTRVLRRRMSTSERKEMDAACGYVIDDKPQKHNQSTDPTP
jgi:uncharacterized protein YegJ (DUF2314 family)